jgi:serine kinase of HPr protein (carbohydrate metabolism regulator)
MTISEAIAALGAEVIQGEVDGGTLENTELTGAHTSDLLSDVMANAKEGGVLVTIQAHKNTVAVASLVNISLIVVCNSRPIPEDMIPAAQDEGIVIIRTRENQFTVSGKLYEFMKAGR